MLINELIYLSVSRQLMSLKFFGFKLFLCAIFSFQKNPLNATLLCKNGDYASIFLLYDGQCIFSICHLKGKKLTCRIFYNIICYSNTKVILFSRNIVFQLIVENVIQRKKYFIILRCCTIKMIFTNCKFITTQCMMIALNSVNENTFSLQVYLKDKIGLEVKQHSRGEWFVCQTITETLNQQKSFRFWCYCNLFGFSMSINSWSIFFNFCNYIDKLLLFGKSKEFLNKRNNFCFIIYLSYVMYSYFLYNDAKINHFIKV